MYIDDDVEWTNDNVRPFYHVREARCLSCSGGGRPVSVDSDIAFICYRRLTAFQVDYDRYDMAVKVAMLDDWPSSSAEPRAYRE